MKTLNYILLVAFLSGCSLAPEYRTPDVKLPKISHDNDGVYKEFLQNKWWHVFENDALAKLEEMALKNNYDLKKAVLSIKEAQTALESISSALVPSINALVSDNDVFINKNKADSSYKGNRYLHETKGGVSASYELDIFAKNINATDAQWNAFLATKMAKEVVYLSLTATVAKAYFNIISLQEQLDISLKTLSSREETFDIFKERLKNGYCTELDLNRIEAELLTAKVTVSQLKKSLSEARSAMYLLVGEDPAGMIAGLLDSKICGGLLVSVSVSKCVPSCIISDLILRRPDVAQAEYELKSCNAKIGEARASFFPSIALTGAFGYESNSLRSLISGGNDSWNLGKSISFPIFSGGAIVAANKIAKIRFERAVESYKNSVRQAFKDAHDAIVANSKNREILNATDRSVVVLQKSYVLAKNKYDAGLIGLLNVLDVERNLLSAKLSAVVAKQNVLNGIVDLCKSIGGSWHR